MSQSRPAELVRQMIKALDAAGEFRFSGLVKCRSCQEDPTVCDAGGYECPGRVCRRALAAWRERGALRDDPGLFHQVDNQLRFCAEAEPLLDLIDAAIFGERSATQQVQAEGGEVSDEPTKGCGRGACGISIEHERRLRGGFYVTGSDGVCRGYCHESCAFPSRFPHFPSRQQSNQKEGK